MKIIYVLAVLSLLILAACASQPENLVGGGTPVQSEMPVLGENPDSVEEMVVVETPSEQAPEEQEAAAQEPAGEVKEIEVTAKKWEFTPDPIRVNLGDRVRLKITSIDVAHGFDLADFGISQRLNPGVTETVEFTADKKGSFTFFCNVQCGSGHGGMRGTLIVE